MNRLLTGYLILFIFLLACQGASQAVDENTRVTLNLFHTNDLMGYLTPCG